ncbi:hypothetical protein WJX77_004294 [Trebouxia sp. C0004]
MKSHITCLGACQAVVEKLKHNYVRFTALQSQLFADLPSADGQPEQQSALKHFIGCTAQGQQYLDRLSQQRPFTNGKHKNGLHLNPAPSDLNSLFLSQMQQEVERLRRFAHSFAEDLWMRLLAAADGLCMLRQTAAKLQSVAHQQDCLLQHQELAAQCDGIGDDLVCVDSFVQHNAIACAYLAFLTDAVNTPQAASLPSSVSTPSCTSLLTLQQLLNAPTGRTKVPAVYKTCLTECLLGTTELDAVLIGLSDLYEQVRLVGLRLSADLSHKPAADLDQQDSEWVAPDWFSRSTTKYWVQPQHRMRVKCEIIKNLPVSIYEGQRRKVAAGDSEDALRFLQQQHMHDSTLVSSVYLDDPDFQTYRSRLRREDGASVVRLRWYGPRTLKPMHVCSLLLWLERCGVEQQHVRQYLEGEGGLPLMSGDGSQALFLRETQQWINSENQAPVLRTLCNRAAFQASSNNEVRISLDSQLHMIRESGASPKQPGDWCSDLGGVLGSGDVTHFQYDVAEVKLGIKARPAWIEDLVHSGLLLRVPKFSKYLHGVASLYPNRIEAIPYWFLPADKEGYVLTPASWEEMADPKDPYLKDAAAWLFPTTEASRAAALRQPPPKSKQLTQRFNLFFGRKKPTQASSEEGQAGTDPQQQLPSSPASGTGLPQTGPEDSVQQPKQAAAAQAEFMPDSIIPRGQTAPQKEGFSAPLSSQPSSALQGLPQLPLRQASCSVPKAPALLRIAQVPYQRASSFQAAAQMPYHPSSSAIVSPALPSDLHILPSQDLWQGPGTLPYSPGPRGAPTPDKEEEQQSIGLRRPPALPAVRPQFESDALAAPLFRHNSSGQMVQPAGPALRTGQKLWEGDLPIEREAQQEKHYQPGMYDGYATMPSQLPDRQQQQQQQQQQQAAWQQVHEQQQLPQQHQQQLPYAATRDHIIDVGNSSQSHHIAPSFEAQRAQRPQRSMSGITQEPNQAAAYPELAQQVPFYESSPQYMPSTLTAKSPIRTTALSKVTAFLGFPKQQTQPKDLEAGADPRPNSPSSAQGPYDPSPPSGCSPKSALLRSGIFQTPKSPDQDSPISTEQAERRARGLVRTRVEPKVFFANERTFLQWLQISVLLMFTGLSLLGGSSVGGSMGVSSGGSSNTCASNNTACKASKYAGVIISPIAILFMVYALFMYKMRTVQILRRANVRYDDQSGPVILVILLIVATLASLVLTAYGTLR